MEVDRTASCQYSYWTNNFSLKKNHTKIESYIECYQNKKGVFFIKKGVFWVFNTPI